MVSNLDAINAKVSSGYTLKLTVTKFSFPFLFANLEGRSFFHGLFPVSEDLSAPQDMFPTGEYTEMLSQLFPEHMWEGSSGVSLSPSVIAGEFWINDPNNPNIDFQFLNS